MIPLISGLPSSILIYLNRILFFYYIFLLLLIDYENTVLTPFYFSYFKILQLICNTQIILITYFHLKSSRLDGLLDELYLFFRLRKHAFPASPQHIANFVFIAIWLNQLFNLHPNIGTLSEIIPCLLSSSMLLKVGYKNEVYLVKTNTIPMRSHSPT